MILESHENRKSSLIVIKEDLCIYDLLVLPVVKIGNDFSNLVTMDKMYYHG